MKTAGKAVTLEIPVADKNLPRHTITFTSEKAASNRTLKTTTFEQPILDSLSRVTA